MCTYCIRSSFWSQIWLEMAQRKDPQSNTRLSLFSQQCWVLQISQLGANPSCMTKQHVLMWSYAHTDSHPFSGFSFKPHDKEMRFKSIKLHKIFFGSALWLSNVEYSLASKYVKGNWVDWVDNQCKNPLVHTDLYSHTFIRLGTWLGGWETWLALQLRQFAYIHLVGNSDCFHALQLITFIHLVQVGWVLQLTPAAAVILSIGGGQSMWTVSVFLASNS